MTKKRIRLIVLVVILVCLTIAIAILLQKFLMHPKTAQNVLDNNPVGLDEAEGVTMMVPGSTQNTYWELNIYKIETTTGDVDKLNQVEGIYYVNKNPVYHLSGKKGTVFLKTRRIEVIGNVKLKATDGSKELNSDRLLWDSLADKITARVNVIMKTPEAVITTEEVMANLKIDHAVFNGTTKVSYQRANP